MQPLNGVTHIAILTPDMDRFIRFYQHLKQYDCPLWLMDVDAVVNRDLGALFDRLKGIDAAMRCAAQFLRTKQAAFSAIIAAPFVVIGLLVPLDVAGAHTAAYADARRVVAPADLGTLTWLARHARAAVSGEGDDKPMDAPLDGWNDFPRPESPTKPARSGQLPSS